MPDLLGKFIVEAQQNSLAELMAVFFAIAYLLLAVRENIACWYAAFISTSIFLVVFWQVQLYMESGLQVYYLVMAVYGWWQWRHPGTGDSTQQLPISTRSWRWHLIMVLAVLVATLVSGTLLSNTDQQLAYIDSFTTWGSVITTYMVARKILENWAYWLVIDGVSIYLYLDRELYFTAALFSVYIIIIFFGWFTWFEKYNELKRA
jgi:nicotinamide mononucleotide transporter